MNRLFPTTVTALILLLVFGPLSAQMRLALVDSAAIILPKNEDGTYPWPEYIYWHEGRLRAYDIDTWNLWAFHPDGRLDSLQHDGSYPIPGAFGKFWMRTFQNKKWKYQRFYVPHKDMDFDEGRVAHSWSWFFFDQQGEFLHYEKNKMKFKGSDREFFQDSYADRHPSWYDREKHRVYIPAASVRSDLNWPCRDSVNVFGVIEYEVEFRGKKKPRLNYKGLHELRDTTEIVIDNLGNEVVNWQHCTDGQGNVYVSHYQTERIRKMSPDGNLLASFGMPAKHRYAGAKPLEKEIRIKELFFNRELNYEIQYLSAKLEIEQSIFRGISYDPKNKLIFRLYSEGMPDSSPDSLSFADRATYLSDIRHRQKRWMQVYDVQNGYKFLGEVAYPAHTTLIGIDKGLLIFRERKLNEKHEVMIYRFRLQRG